MIIHGNGRPREERYHRRKEEQLEEKIGPQCPMGKKGRVVPYALPRVVMETD